MSNAFFQEEHHQFRAGFRAFLAKEVVPHVEEIERNGGAIDRSIWKKMAEHGVFGLVYPEAYGGLGLDHKYTVIYLEEMQRINSGGFAANMWAHTYLAMQHLLAEGDERIKQEYLAPSISGDKIGCLCITEPFAGSDVAAMRTTATADGDHFILNGSKTFITNGVYSDYLVVCAKTDPELGGRGISIFVVDRGTPGISATKLDKLGWRGSDTAEIAFDNVRIPAANLMGERGKGFAYIMQHFALERLIMAVNAHACAEYALEYSLGYMNDRQAFGKSLTEFQVLRHRVAHIAAKVEMHKRFNYTICQQLVDGEYPVKEASMAKMLTTAMCDEVVSQCLQFLGGYGYMEEYPLARMFRDSRLGQIGGGTSEILAEIVAKMVIDKKEYAPAVKH